MLWTRDIYLAFSTPKTCQGSLVAVALRFALKLIEIFPTVTFNAFLLIDTEMVASVRVVLCGWPWLRGTGRFRRSNWRRKTGEFGWPGLRRTGHWRRSNVFVSPWARRTGRCRLKNLEASRSPRRRGTGISHISKTNVKRWMVRTFEEGKLV